MDGITSETQLKRDSDSKKIVSACKKVMFFKYRDDESDESDSDDKIIIPKESSGDAPDADELTSKRPENVDVSLTHSLFKSSGVGGSWTEFKKSSEAQLSARRKSIFPSSHSSAPVGGRQRKVRSQKGLSHIISSMMSNLKLSKRYDDNITVGDMQLTRRQLKILQVAFSGYAKEERQLKIQDLKANNVSIDEKVRILNKKRARSSPLIRSRRVTSDDRLSLPATQNLNENTVRFDDQEQVYFRRWVRIVMIVLRWISVILQISENKRSLDRELKSFTDIATEIERHSQNYKTKPINALTFDKSHYVTNKEITLSQDVRRTLTLRSYARTPAMLQQVMHGLQTLESLAEYPLHIQEKLCQVAWYQSIEPKRAILRQGHFAEFFYFILSGQAFVKKMVENEKTKEPEMYTVARLNKGQSFGEVALLYRTTRTATVESATAMELLMVSGEDFIRIFTRTGSPDEEPSYITFLRQIPVFQTWPVGKIKLDPGSCFLHYFKRGSGVTPDSEKSQWIFIIKSGCCEVLQKLDAVRPRCAKYLGHLRRQTEIKPVLPRENVPSIAPRIEAGGTKTSRKVPIPVEVFDTMKQYFNGLRKADEEAKKAAQKRQREENARKEAEERRKMQQSDLPDWKSFKMKRRKTVTKVSFPDGATAHDSCDSKTLPKIILAKDGGISGNKRKCEGLLKNDENMETVAPTESALLEMYEPIQNDSRVKNKPKYFVRNGSVFVTMELLHVADVFGLNTLNFNGATFETTPKVSLISRGAEIIMLSKKLFMKYADEQTQNLIKEQIKGYPVEGIMQMNLQEEVDWDLYKNTTVKGFLDKLQYQKTLLPTV